MRLLTQTVVGTVGCVSCCARVSKISFWVRQCFDCCISSESHIVCGPEPAREERLTISGMIYVRPLIETFYSKHSRQSGLVIVLAESLTASTDILGRCCVLPCASFRIACGPRNEFKGKITLNISPPFPGHDNVSLRSFPSQSSLHCYAYFLETWTT